MATRFLTNLDLTQNQILNGRFEVLGSDPSSGTFEGWMIYRSDLDVVKYYNGSAWKTLINSVSSAGTHTDAITIVNNSDGTVSITLNLADADSAGLLSSTFYSLLNNATSSNTNGKLALRDSSGSLQVSSPSADLDAANKAYVDGARSGLDIKASVKLATNAALPAYTYSSGVITASADGALSVDGLTPIATNRILVKNETSSNAPYNGIYEVTDTGDIDSPFVLTRTSDANDNAEVTPGMFTFVEQGNTWADSGWILTTDGTVNLGSTNLTFVQFSSAGQSIAGNGLTKTGNTIDVVGTTNRIVANADSIDISADYVGQTSITTLGTVTTGVWSATDIAVTDGGTGASTASDARTNLASTTAGFTTSTPVLARVASQTVTGGSTSFNIDHNFGTRDVTVQVYDVASYDTVVTDIVRASTNRVTVTFSVAPGSSSYRVVVTG
jgi:hypothetical protein